MLMDLMTERSAILDCMAPLVCYLSDATVGRGV